MKTFNGGKFSNSFLYTLISLLLLVVFSLIGSIVLVFNEGVNFMACLGATGIVVIIFILLASCYLIAGLLEDRKTKDC